VLTDGWYEWQVAPGGKQPWFIRREEGRPFAFAGLWERWKDPATGAPLDSCTIVTTEAAASIRRIHDRMPAVLADADWDRWLDPAFSDTEKLSELLKPFAGGLEAWPVSREVNAPRNQGPALIERVG
jgi:putative SOS response-associated peptidase YedK